jgi:restriction endonuclease S subunit
MESLIGTLPVGWGNAPLSELCELQVGPSGARMRAADRVGEGVPLVLAKDVGRGRIADQDLRYVPPEMAAQLAAYSLEAGDIVCTRTGELGRHGRATGSHVGWIFATGLLRLRPGEKVNPSYLAYYLALPTVRDWIHRHSTGTAIPAISARAFGTLPITLPPLADQAAIGDTLAALDEKIELHEQIVRTTGRLRDTLAPLLLTGEISPARFL